jgi:hypothetical protein
MKKSFWLAPVLLIALIATSFRVAPGTLTPDERKYAVDYYQKTKERLLKDLKGLSENQLEWKKDSTRWSIYQCMEHIALSESFIYQWLAMNEHQPVNPDKLSEVKVTTDQIIKMMLDRSHKAQAPEMLKPQRQFADTHAALQAYELRRDSTIEYIRTTQDDLKDHYFKHPTLGMIDVYQGLVFLAAHSERHTEQIEEVMTDPNFPKQ